MKMVGPLTAAIVPSTRGFPLIGKSIQYSRDRSATYSTSVSYRCYGLRVEWMGGGSGHGIEDELGSDFCGFPQKSKGVS